MHNIVHKLILFYYIDHMHYNRTLIWGESWNYLHILDLVTFGRRMRRNATLDRIP
jgi:hypothetical protein